MSFFLRFSNYEKLCSQACTIFPSYQFWDRNHSPESPKYVFRDPGFALFKGWDSGF